MGDAEIGISPFLEAHQMELRFTCNQEDPSRRDQLFG